MKLFGLDPDSIEARVRQSPAPTHIPSARRSVWTGSLGFGLVSVVVFSLWAFGGGWFYKNLGEAGFYAVCALAFIGLTGLFLHKLIIGDSSLGRFYGLFTAAFAAYAACWMGCWFGLGGKHGEQLGALTGIFLMGLILSKAFAAKGALVRVVAILFLAHSAGYFLGDFLFDWFRGKTSVPFPSGFLTPAQRATAGKLAWGLSYGIGFGAGIGVAFYACQETIRERLKALPIRVASDKASH